jgi:pimeloyl-ACP methyl ester carboxylesterase
MARSPLRERRAVLLIDVRGTGPSGPLGCDLQAGGTGVRTDFLPLDRVRACRDSLSRLTDLAKYTAPIVADDIAEVVRALGIRQVNVRGFSGGTRQALELIRRHPDLVRSAILEGPVPMDARVPLTFARDAQTALDGVLEDCAAEPACAAAFPAPGRALQRTLERLSTAPETVRVPLPQGSGTVQVDVTASGVAQVIRAMLYQPGPTRLLPLAISRAAEGDWTLWGERLRTLGVPPGIAMGFYLSATCAEDVPWFSEAEAASSAQGTYLGPYRVQQQKAACAVWPRGELPPTHLRPVRSDIPVLILVGQHDPVTPPRWGAEVAQHLPRSRLVVVPGGGHGFAGLESVECLDSLRTQFITDLAPERLDLTCLATVRRPPFHLAPPN